MLLVTGVLYAIWGELGDAITIFVIILTLNTVQVVNEQRSKKAIAGLRKLAEPTTSVRRDVHFQRSRWSRLSQATWSCSGMGIACPRTRGWRKRCLSVDESALTGESLPWRRRGSIAIPIAAGGTPNMVYSSTLASRGKGTAIVVSTGMDTEIGRIAGMARQVKEPRTPCRT